MAVTRQQKEQILANLVENFKNAQSIGFASSNTLSVAEFEAMRNDLRSVNATYIIAKKTLIKKALKDALDIEVELADLPGQIGAVCSFEDAVAGLGKVNDIVKKTKGEKINWAVSIFEGEFQDNEATKNIAGIPSRETLLGRLAGSMQSPISGLARFFDAAAKDLEEKGKAKVSELEGEKKEDPASTEESATEEAAPAQAEAPKEDTPTEDKKEEKAAQ